MKKIPCAVCEFPVSVPEAQPIMREKRGLSREELDAGKVTVLAVCGNPRCQRLVFDVMEEEGF